MLLMTCPPQKPAPTASHAPMEDGGAMAAASNLETIEMDSLESYSDEIQTQEPSADSSTIPRKHLNLNGICKLDADIVEEIVLPEQSIKTLADLQKISLRSNELQMFPMSVLDLKSLISLDLSNNKILTLPPEISKLTLLRELVLDQNCISVLPGSLWELQHLRILRVADNRLVVPPPPPDMRAFVLTDAEKNTAASGENGVAKTNALTNLNLRANRLKGNIILGNYGNLTELDVSENSIESLDLIAVGQLQVLQCSRNALTHLKIHGKHLVSLIAGNNRLTKLTVQHPPTGLRHMDVSFNDLEELPEWLSCCHELRSLFASNNNMKLLPDHLFCNEMPYLHTLQLAYNQLQSLPSIQRRLPLQELFLQNNSLSMLPDNFFKSIYNIRVLNLSNNRLCELPIPEENLLLEKLFLTANCLTNKSMERLGNHMRCLRILHAAYNNFTLLPDDCASSWPDIEEIVLSGNKLLRLPESIGRLKHLGVLRVHSNLLQSCPKLSYLTNLRVLDLAHNQLDRIDLSSLVPSNLKFLDLSCNTKLHVDSQQFHNYRAQRPMSLVDVSGKNRTSLPLTPSPFCENDLTESSWSVGFSETAGTKPRLYVSQVRLPAFCNTEAMFAMFDGENSNDMPGPVDKVVPRILLEERTLKETASEYMKYTMLSAHRELKDKGQKYGMSAIIIHILKSRVSSEFSFCGTAKKYVMKVASVGDVRAVLGRATGPVRVIPANPKKQLRTAPQLQLMVPDPDVTEIMLDEHDEYLIIANKNLWDVISPDAAVKEVNAQRNVILAAKRLQDLAQSYGSEDNLSVIVVRFNIVGSDVDLLMRELRQTIKKNKYQSESGISSTTTTCQPGCCCETITMSCTHCLDKIPAQMMHNNNGDDRSSPSGQSDQACSDCNSSAKLFIQQLNKNNEINRSIRSANTYESAEAKTSSERRSYRGGVAKAVRSRREEDRNREDTDSALSEEQFKCWEYMLEQNTQLLFDKELNTLNKGTKHRSQFIVKNPTLSRSSPHLAAVDATTNLPAVPFLSRQFGSTRSFNPLMTRSSSRYAVDKKQLLVGGPHAAYFGSLQRLMPYNLEYDFAVMQERGLADSLDLDRMQQYWGVTTTEL